MAAPRPSPGGTRSVVEHPPAAANTIPYTKVIGSRFIPFAQYSRSLLTSNCPVKEVLHLDDVLGVVREVLVCEEAGPHGVHGRRRLHQRIGAVLVRPRVDQRALSLVIVLGVVKNATKSVRGTTGPLSSTSFQTPEIVFSFGGRCVEVCHSSTKWSCRRCPGSSDRSNSTVRCRMGTPRRPRPARVRPRIPSTSTRTIATRDFARVRTK